MYNPNELESLSNCLNSNISYLENYLKQYKSYLSQGEIVEKIKEIQDLKILQIKTECILGNKALEGGI